MDEIRVQTVERSGDWLLTEFNNQNDPSGFLQSISGETSCSAFTFNNFCLGPPITYSVPNTAGHTYLWTVAGGTPSATTGNSITVNWGAVGPYTIQLQETVGSCTGSSITYTVTPATQPVAQTITKLPNVTDVCVTGSVSATFSGGSGGVNPVDEYQYSVDGGTSWLDYTSGSPISSATAGANRLQIRTRRASAGSGCSTSVYNTAYWNTVLQPSWNTYSFPTTSVCIGGAVTFSATEVNGLGGTINWIRSTSPGGSGVTVTSPDAPPAAGTYYYRPQYTATGYNCSLADGTETTVVVQVDPTWNTVTTPVTNICIGGSVTFSATLNNAGTGTVQWIRSLTAGGAGVVVTSPDTPVAAGTYYYRPQYVPGYGGCNLADGTETTVVVQVDPTWNTVTTPVTNICIGGSVTFSATLNNAGTGTVQWIRSLTAGGAGVVVTSPDTPVAAGTYYYRPQYVPGYGGCNLADGTETTVVVQVDPTWNTVTTPVTNICIGGSVTFSATLNNAGTGTVQWIRSLTAGGAGVVVTSPDTPVAAGTYYYRPQYVPGYGGCNLADGTETTVVVQVDPTWNTVTTPVTNICIGGSVTFSATLNNAGTGTVQWIRSLTAGGAGVVVTSPDTPVAAGTYYYRPQYVPGYGGCNLADGTETTVVVQVDPTWNTVTTPVTNICIGGSVTFSATLNNAGTGTVQWIRSLTAGGAGVVVTSPDTPVAAGTYYYRPQYVPGYGGCNLADGTETTVVVQVDPTWNTVTTPVTNICIGGSVTFSATLNNAGTGTVQWIRSLTAGGAGVVVTSPDTPVAAGTYYYRPQYVPGYGGCNLADGTETTVVVQVDPTWNTVTTPVTNICIGGSVTFSATLNNAGTGTVQWIRSLTAGGAGVVVTSPDTPVAAGTYYYRPQYVPGYGGCNLADGTETTVVVQVDPTWNTVTTPVTNICIGGSVTFSATLNNAGTGTVQWIRSLTAGGAGVVVTSPDTPVAAGTYYYRPQYVPGYGGCNLADGTETTVVVQVDPTWNTVTTPVTNICIGGSVTFSATLNNAGTGTVQWIRSLTAGGAGVVVTSPDTPVAAGTYYYRPQYVPGYGGCNLADGTETTVVVQVDPTWNTVTTPVTNICIGGSVTFSATLNNAGTGTVQWIRSLTAGGAGVVVTSPDTPVAAGTYYYRPQYVPGYGGCNLADGTETTVVVQVDPTWNTVTTPVTNICIGGSVTFSATLNNAGTGTVQWIRSLTAGGAGVVVTSPDTPVAAGTYYYRPQYVPGYGGCNLADGTETTVVVQVDPTWNTVTTPVTNICIGGSVTFSATLNNAGTGTVQWIRSLTAGGAGVVVTSPDTPVAAGTYYYRPQYVPGYGGCNLADGTETTVVVQVDPTWNTVTTPVTNICIGGSVTFSATLNNAGTGTVQWIRSLTAGGAGVVVTSPDTPVAAGTYYYRPQYVPGYGGCNLADGTETTVVVQVDPTWNTVTTPVTNICIGGSVTFSATLNNAGTGTVQWIRSLTAGGAGVVVTSPDTPVAAGTYYYRPQYVPGYGGCNLADGTETTVVVQVDPTWNTVTTPVTNICIGGSVTFSATLNNAGTGTVQWIRSLTAGGAGVVVTSPDTPVAAGTYYYRPQYVPGYGGCNLADGTETMVTVNPLPIITIDPVTPVCNTSTSFNLPYSGTTYLPTTYSITAGVPAMPGFVPIVNEPITASPLIITIPLGVPENTYQFIISVRNANGCISVSQSLNVTVYETQVADAGNNQNLCGTLSSLFEGNIPAKGTGTWAYVSGPDNSPLFGNANSPVSSINVDLYGTYVFRWTIVNGACQTFDDVTIDFNEDPTGLSAGTDQSVCGVLVTALTGSEHIYQIGSEHNGSTVIWSQESGPGTIIFTDPLSPTTSITADLYGTYVLRWTETNGNCSRSDDVSVSFAESAVAGDDQDLCGVLITTLNGNTPSTGTGTWSVLTQPVGSNVAFGDINNPASTVSVDMYGIYQFKWTLSSPVGLGCNTSDDVTIWFDPTPSITSVNDTICNNDYTNIIVQTSTTNSRFGIRYTWTATDVDNAITGEASSTDNGNRIEEIIRQQLFNADIAAHRITYLITPWTIYPDSSLRCSGPQITIDIWVEPTPRLSLVPPQDTICDGETTNIEILSPTQPTLPVRFDYSVAVDDADSLQVVTSGSGIGLLTGAFIQETFNNLSDRKQRAVITVTSYTVTSTGALRCTGIPSTIDIWVEPTPRLSLVPPQDTICDGETTNIEILSPTQPTLTGTL